MPTRASFVAFILDSLQPLGAVTSRALFGGHGVYLDGQIFGLIDDDRLFFKVDELSREKFEVARGEPFTYAGKKGQRVMAGYWTPPDSAMDDPEALIGWARLGLEAAARAGAKKKSGPAKTRVAGRQGAAPRASDPSKRTVTSKPEGAAGAPAKSPRGPSGGRGGRRC